MPPQVDNYFRFAQTGRSLHIIGLLLSLVVSACSRAPSGRLGGSIPPTTETNSFIPYYDEWENLPVGDDVIGSRWKELGKDQVFHVVKQQQPEAVRELNSVAVVSLNREKLAKYLGRDVNLADGQMPFLVRAVAIEHMATGGFTVLKRKKELWVRFVCLGNQLARKIKSPLIVLLDEAPEAVYVDAKMTR